MNITISILGILNLILAILDAQVSNWGWATFNGTIGIGILVFYAKENNYVH